MPVGSPCHPPASLLRRRSLTLALSAVAWPCRQALAGTSASAPGPGLDLLERPAPRTRRGATRRLLGVAVQGTRWVAVGEMGLVIVSTDGGKNWRQALVPTSVMLTAVAAVGPNSWCAAGHDGVVLVSRDAGQTWQRRFDGNAANSQMLLARQRAVDALATSTLDKPRLEQARDAAENLLSDAQAAQANGPSLPLFALCFIDARRGFAAGAQGQLFATDDGGVTWRYIGDRLDNPEGLHLYALHAGSDGTLLAAAEAGALFRSRDSGTSWVRLQVGTKVPLYGARDLGSGHPGVWVTYGLGGRVFRSVDDGRRWSGVPSSVTRAFVSSARMADGGLLLATQDGSLLHSADGGLGFLRLEATVPVSRLTAMVAAADANTLVLVGPQGVATMPLPVAPARRS